MKHLWLVGVLALAGCGYRSYNSNSWAGYPATPGAARVLQYTHDAEMQAVATRQRDEDAKQLALSRMPPGYVRQFNSPTPAQYDSMVRDWNWERMRGNVRDWWPE